MSDHERLDRSSLLDLTTRIVSAQLAATAATVEEVPAIIRSVFDALAAAPDGSRPTTPHEPASPAVPIRKSVFPEYIVCLEDGKKLKMLKRHLQTSYGMTPEQYRQKWGLPRDYPMVAPAYAQKRSSLAKTIGLGRKKSAQPAIQQVPEGKRGTRKPRIDTVG